MDNKWIKLLPTFISKRFVKECHNPIEITTNNNSEIVYEDVIQQARDEFYKAAREPDSWEVNKENFYARYKLVHSKGFWLKDERHVWLGMNIILSYYDSEYTANLLKKLYSKIEQLEKNEKAIEIKKILDGDK